MDVVADFKNELDVECPGNNISSPISAVQFLLKYISGTFKYIFYNVHCLWMKTGRKILESS